MSQEANSAIKSGSNASVVISLIFWFLSLFGHLVWVHDVWTIVETGDIGLPCSGCMLCLAFLLNLVGAVVGLAGVRQAR